MKKTRKKGQNNSAIKHMKQIERLTKKTTDKRFNQQDAQTVYDTVFEYVEQYRDCYESELNLKLPDLSYYCNEMVEKFAESNNLIVVTDTWKIFDAFCEDAFYMFKEWMNEENISFDILKYIGRTSSFRIGDLYDVNPYKRQNIMECIFPDSIAEITSDGRIFYREEYEKSEIKDDIEWIVDHGIEVAKEYLDPIIKVYDYIANFKKNELQYFSEWLSDMWEFNAVFFDTKTAPYSDFPVQAIENYIEDLENYKTYTCISSQDEIIYSKIEKVKSILKGEEK